MSNIQRLGFFSRLLDDATAAERYRLVTEQIVHAEALGFDSAWVAQHHFHEAEGGLPSPLVFLASVAARTHRIRLGTGIVTLPLENPVRVAEDAVVLDLIAGGRLEFGVGTGGTPSSFTAFGQQSEQRAAVFASHLAQLREAWAGRPLPGGDRLYPVSAQLPDRVWQASFSVSGGARAGLAGDGLMLSRTQPRPADAPQATLADIQLPIIEAYLAALPAGRAPRIVGSRSVFVANDRALARRLAEEGLRRSLARQNDPALAGVQFTLDELIARQDVHVGTPDEVIASLRADRTLLHVTDLVCQVHSVDPPHRHILRSIELIATEVAPALGWAGPSTSATPSHSSLAPLQAIA
ncbi:putative FMN-dependent luciferase-like monooxygenase [Variovorax sp. LT1R16]|uniref:putative FMN-dependent luciferase-like monooxygenase n=1 Tax=Variovorax sp. LT1R16 TaxID=3443728 RepID=UPI003F48EF53